MNDFPSVTVGTAVANDVALRQMMQPIAQYMSEDLVREVTIPRPGLILVRRWGQWHRCEDATLTFDYLQALVSTMASYNSVNFSSIMSLLMPDGERGQVAQPPAVINGTLSINIRKHANLVKTLVELNEDGAFDSWVNVSPASAARDQISSQDRELLDHLERGDMLGFLTQAVTTRKNIIVSGKTGSGKTTFARSLIECVPTTERLLTVEDVHELILPNHENKVHMIYGIGAGRVTATDCIAAAMRSSPDRIFLSELRGPEAWDYLSALNTGHPGSVTTTHANSAVDTYRRVALLVKQSIAGNSLDVPTILQYLRSTLDISLYFADYKLAEVYFNPGPSSGL